MANHVVKMVKKGTKAAVQTPVQLTSGNNAINFQVIDQNGNPIAVPDPSKVTTTLTTDNPSVAITAGADALNWSMSVPTTVTSPFTLTATLTYNDGSAGPFTASVQCTPPPAAQVPTDVVIVIAATP